MSLQLLAKQMESKGRDGDSVLVHMTHGEVAGLQALAESAGSSLSVNPETGLAEANILENLLPAIIGGALMMTPGGMPLAIAGGALVGGYQAKRAGQDPLTGMITGGLGAYGGAGLAGSLGAAGAANAGANAMTQEALAQQAAQQLQSQGVAQAANVASTIGGTAPTATATQALNAFGLNATNSTLPAAASSAVEASAPSIYGTEAGAQAINEAYAKGASDYANKGFFDRVGGGFDALGTQTGRDAAMTEAGGGKGLFKSGLAALAPAAAAAGNTQQESPYPLMSMDIDRSVTPFQDIQAYQAPQRSLNYQGNNVYIPLSTVRAAEGGLMGLAKGGMKSGGFVVPADVTSLVGEGNTEAGYKRISAIFPGAVPIRGEDGGQADTVKTNIEGKQPAAVAHGEMYIPPEDVEAKGGAKVLYSMMDKVRQQATGSKKQVKPVSLKRALA
jgi:hypothetical protein